MITLPSMFIRFPLSILHGTPQQTLTSITTLEYPKLYIYLSIYCLYIDYLFIHYLYTTIWLLSMYLYIYLLSNYLCMYVCIHLLTIYVCMSIHTYTLHTHTHFKGSRQTILPEHRYSYTYLF